MSQVITLKKTPTSEAKATFWFDRPPMLPATVSNETLLRAVKNAALGVKNVQLAEMLGVPEGALEYWTRSKEWKAIREQVEPEIQKLVVHVMHDMVGKCLRELGDRLEHGEKKINRQIITDSYGNVKVVETVLRNPLDAGTLMSIASTLIDKADRLDRKANGEASPEDDQVRQLAQRLREYDKATEVEAEVVEVPDSEPKGVELPLESD